MTPASFDKDSRSIVGVMGPSVCDEKTYETARTLGRLLAAAGYAVLCGGRGGVMEAVARGASEAGGLTIGILPGLGREDSQPNPWIQIPIFTGLSFARNSVNVLSSSVVVAIGGGPGTLSEIALAIKYGKPLVLLDSWSFAIHGWSEPANIRRVTSPEEALARVRELIGPARASTPGGCGKGSGKPPA